MHEQKIGLHSYLNKIGEYKANKEIRLSAYPDGNLHCLLFLSDCNIQSTRFFKVAFRVSSIIFLWHQ